MMDLTDFHRRLQTLSSEESKEIRQALDNLCALARDISTKEAEALAMTLVAQHRDWKNARSVTDIERCLQRFFLLQTSLRTIAGVQTWMKSPGHWAQLIYQMVNSDENVQ